MEFTSLAATTAKEYVPRISDNLMRSNALIRYMREKKRVTVDGGSSRRYAFKKAFNNTVTNISGSGLLDIAEQDNFDWIEYTRVGYNIAIVYTDEEMDQNSGASRAVDLVKAKITNGETDLLNVINADLWGHARSTKTSSMISAAKPLHSIPYFLSATPAIGLIGDVDSVNTNGGTNAGAKDRATYTMLRNKQAAATGAWGNATNKYARLDINSMFTKLRRSRLPNEVPDLGLCGITALNLIQQEQIAIERDTKIEFTNEKSFGSVDAKVNNVNIYMDELCDADMSDPFDPVPETTGLSFYMFTTRFMEFIISKNFNFKSIPAQRPYDRAMFIQHLRVFLQLCCENPTRQGVITAIS